MTDPNDTGRERPSNNNTDDAAPSVNTARLAETTPDPIDQGRDPYPKVTPRSDRAVDDPAFLAKLDEVVRQNEADPDSYDGKLIRDQIITALKLATDGRDTGELKLMTAAFKELRYAFNVFSKWKNHKKISIFGSARTQPNHADYEACVEFSRGMAERDWLCITGAGDGIMKAGHEGPGPQSSFGLAIRLPFETTANDVIAGDEKLINFRYFFTRKLIFVSQSEAVAAFPGGYGTQDEVFEALTLIQTGKSAMIPIVLCEHEGGDYWHHWDNYVKRSLLNYGMISPEDVRLYHICRDVDEAADHVCRFYRNFHSYRYVRDDLVIRLNSRLREEDVDTLNKEFATLVKTGSITQRGPYEVEDEFLELPRIAFHHTRHNVGLVRKLIDRINDFTTVTAAPASASG